MARVSLVGRSRTSGAAKEAFERKIAERGNIPNMYRVFAHRPWLLTTMDAHFAAVMGSGTLPLKLKEVLALQPPLENRSRYCSASHSILAERTGSTPEQIAALRDVEHGPFSEKEKAALRFSLHMPRDANAVPEPASRLPGAGVALRRGRDRGDCIGRGSLRVFQPVQQGARPRADEAGRGRR